MVRSVRPSVGLNAIIGLRAIVTGKHSRYNSVDDLKGTTFAISRSGR